jgi:hypothetical protein
MDSFRKTIHLYTIDNYNHLIIYNPYLSRETYRISFVLIKLNCINSSILLFNTFSCYLSNNYPYIKTSFYLKNILRLLNFLLIRSLNTSFAKFYDLTKESHF